MKIKIQAYYHCILFNISKRLWRLSGKIYRKFGRMIIDNRRWFFSDEHRKYEYLLEPKNEYPVDKK